MLFLDDVFDEELGISPKKKKKKAGAPKPKAKKALKPKHKAKPKHAPKPPRAPKPAAKPKKAKKPAPTPKLAAHQKKLAKLPPAKRKAAIVAVEQRFQERGYPPGAATDMLAPDDANEPDDSAPDEPQDDSDDSADSDSEDDSDNSEDGSAEDAPDSSDDDDLELGFVGAAVSALPMAAKALGKIGKVFKKKKKKKGHVTTLPTTNIVGEVPSARTEILKAAANSSTKSEMVQNLADSLPGHVRAAVLDAIKSNSADNAKKTQTIQAISGTVDTSLKPKIQAMLATLKAKQISSQATYEHDKLVQRANFQNGTTSALNTLLGKIQNMEKRLGSVAIVKPGKIPVYGSRNVLES